ncbi:DNA-directed RNA polymerase I subunit RPA2-like isoform X2 [Stegodyphus dumicola]|uniref:DNA-directed RNA polymerase I subunit RPA2-like isoform X2 n=1 Tax=Stegodyphus dumicola TaxID=202533 RepID=UPI0015B21731|nr:DNA-directed RNA polymerase I subunit RPA2-like isoform X2 [Stegodyphus dumicola]
MLLLKALIDKSDYFILQEIIKFRPDDIRMRRNLIDMLRLVNSSDAPVVRLHQQAKNFIGAMFCPVLGLPPDTTNCEAADFLFRKCLLIHLETNEEKFNFLCFAVSKLFHIVHTKCEGEDIDNPVFQEMLSPCQIYMIPIKEGITMFLHSVKNNLTRRIQKYSFGRGNFPGRNWGLMSDTGYTVQVKRRNIFDTIAQFTGLYKFSMEHYSAEMRKFYPESWGFICPVQTPEGENTGLYNQLTTGTEVVSFSSEKLDVISLFKMGIIPFCDPILETKLPRYVVYIDGIIFGFVDATYAQKFVAHLHHKRSNRNNMFPLRTEIVFIDKKEPQFLYPGIYIFSSPCRMVRKIRNKLSGRKAFIGTFEQMCVNIAVQEKENSVYIERKFTDILSIAAGLIPFSEYNPGTRNIFSSVKCRQGISIACHNSSVRGDKRYNQMMYPQSPIISTVMYSHYNFEDYPVGSNVIIAVLAYSGFDMEDAIVLNKASLERGLFTDIDWKTVYYDFNELERECEVTKVENACHSKAKTQIEFKRNPADPHIEHLLDNDGLPYIGRIVRNGDVILSVHSTKTDIWIYKKYEGKKAARVESVKFLGVSPASLVDGRKLPTESKKVAITYCMKRVPEVGDKFSNWHGQKGICGTLLPSADLPFSASGIVPDIIFNPHGISYRMTIGMLLEIMAAKAALLKGEKYDVEPFKYSNEAMSAADICGKKLREVAPQRKVF